MNDGININIDVNDKILCYLYGIFINIVGNECFCVRNGARYVNPTGVQLS